MVRTPKASLQDRLGLPLTDCPWDAEVGVVGEE